MFRIIANSTISFGLGYMFSKSEPPDLSTTKNIIKNNFDVLIGVEKNIKDIQSEQEQKKYEENEKSLYHKYRVKYDEKGRAIYYGAP